MFRLSLSIIAVAFVPAPVTPTRAADKKPNPRQIINKGITFLGGAKNLKKYRAATWDEKGVYHGMGEPLPYTGKYAIQWPDKFRMEIVGIFTTVLNGDKGWNSAGGKVTELSKDQIAQQKEQHYFGMVTQLHPLRDKKFTLTYDGEEKVDGKAADIVNVASKGHQDARLFFDPKTGALVKSEWKAPMDQMPKKLATYVTYYGDYKSAGAIKYPAKVRMLRDGRKFVEATLTAYKPAESLDGKLFEKPK